MDSGWCHLLFRMREESIHTDRMIWPSMSMNMSLIGRRGLYCILHYMPRPSISNLDYTKKLPLFLAIPKGCITIIANEDLFFI